MQLKHLVFELLLLHEMAMLVCFRKLLHLELLVFKESLEGGFVVGEGTRHLESQLVCRFLSLGKIISLVVDLLGKQFVEFSEVNVEAFHVAFDLKLQQAFVLSGVMHL